MAKTVAPVLRISTLPPTLVDLTGARPEFACPGCGVWMRVLGKRVPVHRGDNRPDVAYDKTRPNLLREAGLTGRPRCSASGRELVVDITAEQVAARRFDAEAAARHRHGTRLPDPMVPPVPAPVPVFRLRQA